LKLIGERVKHKTFGNGEIIEFDNKHVVVSFPNAPDKKKFVYPMAFGTFLELENALLLKQIEEATLAILLKHEAERIREKQERNQQEEMIKMIKLKDHNLKQPKTKQIKASETSNVAIKCNYCDGGKSKEVVGFRGVCSDETMKFNIKEAKHVWCSQPENMCCKYLNREISREQLLEFYETTKAEFSKSVCYESQMLDLWKAGAGITHSGDRKGQPMKLKNVKANSLALLTTKLPDAEEKDRFIFAAFLIDDHYEGDNKEEGSIGADQKFRIALPLDEAMKLKFWDYYFNPNQPERIFLGTGLHRYMTDIQAAQILKKIVEIKKGTIEETLSLEFLDHFCKINKTDIDSICDPEGALKR
jgi:hypothetical protein